MSRKEEKKKPKYMVHHFPDGSKFMPEKNKSGREEGMKFYEKITNDNSKTKEKNNNNYSSYSNNNKYGGLW